MSGKPEEADEVSVVDASSGGYRVVFESCPRIGGLHPHEGYITRRVIGTYVTKADAIKAAKRERSDNPHFQSWAEGVYGNEPPPYNTLDSTYNTPDSPDRSLNGEDFCIRIEDATATKSEKVDIPAKRTRSSTRAVVSNKMPKTEADETSSETYPVGTKISKMFDGAYYSGEVVSYDDETKYYKVKYEDGDQEDMVERQIKRYIETNTTTYPVGTKISKKFGGVSYSGEVLSYDVKTKYYRIKYEDGDQEDMVGKQIKRYLVKSEPPRAPTERKFGEVKHAEKAILATIDTDRFLRNPCCVAGGQQHPAKDYAKTGHGPPLHSYYYLVQRLSDRNYAMRGLCIDGDGVQYTTFRKPNQTYPAVAFLPKTDLNHHSKNPTIVDACHLDMIHPKTGECLLRETNLLEAVTPETECLFLNGFQNGGPSRKHSQKVDPNVLVKLIDKCKDSLLCFSLTECIISNEILHALASCKRLRGLTLYTTQACTGSSGATLAVDEGLEAIIAQCTELRWLYVVDCGFFRDECWNALDGPGACPNLEVLWVTSQNRRHVCHGDHDVVRRALRKRIGTLKLCMINCDTDLRSRYVLDGTKETDRLEGDAGPPKEIAIVSGTQG